jgi:hypothetical protein
VSSFNILPVSARSRRRAGYTFGDTNVPILSCARRQSTLAPALGEMSLRAGAFGRPCPVGERYVERLADPAGGVLIRACGFIGFHHRRKSAQGAGVSTPRIRCNAYPPKAERKDQGATLEAETARVASGRPRVG